MGSLSKRIRKGLPPRASVYEPESVEITIAGADGSPVKFSSVLGVSVNGGRLVHTENLATVATGARGQHG